ncbi:MAG: hypothetical protein ACAH65_09965, partial [Chloroflexota bacterium]
MKLSRFDWDGQNPSALAAQIRTLQPALGEVSEAVAEIIDAVRAGGDRAVAELEARFGGESGSGAVRQPDDRISTAP